MRSSKSTDKRGRAALRLLLGIAILGMLPVFLWAQAPGWWITQGVLKQNATANDYAAVNQGQLKNIATGAYKELQANLPGGVGDMTPPDASGSNAGAGYNLAALISKWSDAPNSGTDPLVIHFGSNTNDYAAVNLGQLKTVAKPFYDRLIAVGYTNQYPWTTSTNAANDYAMANIGQVKNLFSFDAAFKTDPNNPLPDWWQMKYFGKLGIDPADDPDGDGITNTDEFLQGTNPLQSVDLNHNGLPDDWETFHANSFAAWPSQLNMSLWPKQSGTATLILNNPTAQPIQYSVALTNNITQNIQYLYVDSKTGGVSFTWEDISQSGTMLTGDTMLMGYWNINFSFFFPFYMGEPFCNVKIGQHGELILGADPDAPHAIIAALWGAIDVWRAMNGTSAGGGALYYKEDYGRLIVQYQNIPNYGGNESFTFQVVLSSDGTIEFRYKDLVGDVTNCTVGIQNSDGSDGLQIAYNQAYLENNMAIRIKPVATFIEAMSLSGTVPAGATSQLDVAFHGLELSPGSYTANIQVAPTSGTDSLIIPATLEVLSHPPQVAITTPTEGFIQWAGDPLSIIATATDSDAAIQRVEFYDGSTKIGEVNSGSDDQFQFSWSGLTSGSHSITAKAVNVFGRTTTSEAISGIGLPDSDHDGIPDGCVFKINQPVQNQTVPLHSTVPVSALVEGFPDITDVTFYVQAGTGQWGSWLPFGKITSAPYNGTIEYIGFGDYAIKAVCHTKQWGTFTTEVVTIHVINPDADGDGLPDAWELMYFGDLNQGSYGDPDGDGVSNLEEYRNGSNPMVADTDGDGVMDGIEIGAGSNPTVTYSTPSDCNQVSMRVGISDEDFNDDVWGVQMKIADENGAFTGTPQDVIDNQGNAQGTSWTTVYIPIGRSVKFNLKRIEAGQGRYSDEYIIHLDPQGEGADYLVADPGNSPTTGSLPWTGEKGNVPPNPGGLSWTFTAVEPAGGGSDIIMPVDDATGSRYRKIALNGRPMPDEKPHHSAESNEPKEETYVDAMTLGVRHSTTEIYIPIPGSKLALSARRDATSENWNDAGGLRPTERVDRPFGACWTSNLSPIIDYVQISNQPDYMNVTDESGAQHRFLFANSGTNSVIFVPIPTSAVETSDALGKLEWANGRLAYTGKFGNVIEFDTTNIIWRSYHSDRKHNTDTENHFYYRAKSVVDPAGTGLTYSYSDSTAIPSRIALTNNPSQFIAITTTNTFSTYLSDNMVVHASVIDSITDPIGRVWHFNYTSVGAADANTVASDAGTVDLLSEVSRPDNSVIKYTYDVCGEPDSRSWLSAGDKVWNLHCDIKSVRTPLSGEVAGNPTPGYTFNYALDCSKFDHSTAHGYYQKTGLPRNISGVTMPNGSQSSFQNQSFISVRKSLLGVVELLPGTVRKSKVTDAAGNITFYEFTDGVPVEGELDEALGFARSSNPIKIFYKTMTITHCLPDNTPISVPTKDGINYGREIYGFNIEANMALSSVTDLSGNITTYGHTDPITYSSGTNPLQSLFKIGIGLYYDDPSTEVTSSGTKTFTYGPWRTMCKSVDERGGQTTNTVDSKGRRLSEIVQDVGVRHWGEVSKETYFTYGNSSFPGVVTEKRVTRHAGDPDWCKDLVTSYSLDSAGNILTETVDSGGLNLVTQYTYDNNDNKKTSTDPKGNLTKFDYDNLNRLVTVTYADGSTKGYGYDFHGNKTSETDENGHTTRHLYDFVDRLTQTRRVMDSDSPATDLVTK